MIVRRYKNNIFWIDLEYEKSVAEYIAERIPNELIESIFGMNLVLNAYRILESRDYCVDLEEQLEWCATHKSDFSQELPRLSNDIFLIQFINMTTIQLFVDWGTIYKIKE
jgi:hypothetical protein